MYSTYASDDIEVKDAKGLLKAKKTIFDLAAKMPDHSVVGPRSAEKEVVTTGLTYQKGAWVLHMLRQLMGEVNFRKGIRSYYAKYFNDNASTEDFRLEMEKASGMRLDKFFQQWLYQPTNPTLQVSWKFEKSTKKLILDVEQVQLGNTVFEAPIQVACYFKGSKQPFYRTIRLKERKQRFVFQVNQQIDRLEFDPGNTFLCNLKL